jgi:hypothetical protein
MTPLDPPAAAARRQWALDRMVESLVGWGCPLESAPHRAQQLLDHVLDVGYALPTVLQGPPARGGGSTEEGRRAARAVFEAALRGRRAGTQQPAGQDRPGDQVSPHPPERPSASQGVDA